MTKPPSSGELFIVATPIGNLADLTHRAIETLKEVDLILAEDTRHTNKLLNALGIKQAIQSFHAHNEAQKSDDYIKLLQNGQRLALVSDAGTPLISDPGYPLVSKARGLGIRVTPIPGPCAITTALSACGLPCDKFYFEGFLPAKQSARVTRLQSIAEQKASTVIYESTHRILACLQDMQAVFEKDRQVVLAKELTKCYECFRQASPTALLDWLAQDTARQKGEFVLIVSGHTLETADEREREINEMLKILLAELPLKQAVKLTAKLTKGNKNRIYQMALNLV